MQEKLDKILDKLTEQTVYLARLDERIKPALASIEHLEEEVDSLKRWKWTVAGGLGLLSIIAPFLMRIVIK